MERDQQGNANGESPGRTERGSSQWLADDLFYRALASRMRRRLLYHLTECEQSTVDELAAALVGWEAGEQGEMASPEQYEKTRVALRHSDLPLLAEAELVTYDEQAETVTLTELDETVTWLLDRSIAAEG